MIKLRRLRFGLVLLLLAAGIAAGQTPAVATVSNTASGIVQGLPNGGIAQGSVFLVVGSNLGPAPLAIAAAPFQGTNVGGTSVSIVVNNTTVNALMYYASATQIAALLPSNTPVGIGALTVTANGAASNSTLISIVPNNFGIFTVLQNGTGPAIVTYPDYSLVSAIPGTGALGGGGPYTYGGAANVGDTLVLWGTGLGPVSGSDAAGAGLGVSMPNPAVNVWLGGVAATVSYQGRSGCCIGEDQIIFSVPAGVPVGCAVPLSVQIGTEISNGTVLPVAAGSRSCTAQSPAYEGAAATMLTGSAPFNYGSFQMGRRIGSESSSGVTYQDFGLGQLAQVSVPAASQPTVLSLLDTPPSGTCITSSSQASPQPVFSVLTGLDAGAVTVTGPNGQVVMKEQRGGVGIYPTSYSAVLSASGVYFSGGAYKVTAAGGSDIKSFTTGFSITQTPSWPSSDQARLDTGNGVARSKGMTINWNNGSAAYSVEIDGSATTSNADGTASVGASFSCFAPSAAGTFNIPASVLMALPSTSSAELDFKPTLPPLSFSAAGLDLGTLTFQYQTTFFVPFN
jgi:uncharacterized protein (TIGR03437 family)